jgi:NAD+ synthase/NAD+ synthase (glutamine-hydrolysing)
MTLRLALATMNPTVGDVRANAAVALERVRSAAEAGADLVVLPELCISGYPPKDLLLQQRFLGECVTAAHELARNVHAMTRNQEITVIVGLPLPARARGIANSLIALRASASVGRYDKRLLPTYDVFDEDRYFTPGTNPVVIDVTPRGGHAGIAPVRVGLSICEDLWKGEDAGFSSRYVGAADPVAELVEAGAQVLVSPSASPFVLGKGGRHRDILARHASRHRIFVASVNQLGGNDELVFDGHAYVYGPDGSLAAASRRFSGDLLIADLHPTGPRDPKPPEAGLVPDVTPITPSVAPDEPEMALLFAALTAGVRDYLAKNGFSKVLIGLSGGIDSALTAVIAVAALGPANVTGVSMPGPYSSDHSVTDAIDLAKRLGITCLSMPIGGAMEGFRATIDPGFERAGLFKLGERLPDLTEENLQSRLRGTMLMALSNRTGALVLTTGNKSELAVGYCTLYGDMNGGLAVLSDVSKQLVYALSRWINEAHATLGFATPPIPASTLDKPPSAELRPDQKDQDSLPPYDVLDRIITAYVEDRKSASSIVQETGYDAALVARILRLIDRSEFKRAQAAVGLKVTTVAFGSGRRWPIAQRWTP